MKHWVPGFLGRSARALVLLVLAEPALAQAQDSVSAIASAVRPQAHLSFQISSGLGANAASGGNVLWNVTLMLGTPILNNDMLWVGIVPTMVPQSLGDETAADGFTPLVIQYQYDFHAFTTTPFLYANAGIGPQFGDRSNHSAFQATMCSVGAGIRDGTRSGFFGQLGITYNNVPTSNAREFLIVNAGIFF
jgi:hypothetical protein